eukprot:TRINITY_DN15208_c0_g1_i1.p1 TRINITY_DN15208_c0_g1~~TRINITY_DN15208_c0_g1_i1.p1  ORF type:complete len:535 (-),score=83.76 TRINITY_DN15208_c0_g1_i1:48-1652(-)
MNFSDFFSPKAHITAGIFGCVPKFSKNQYSVTLLLPRIGSSGETPASFRWKFSSRFTAIHSVALNTLCLSLMTSGSALQQSFFCRLTSFYSVVIASSLPQFVDSSLMVLGFYGLHTNENIHVAARMLLQSVIERLNYDDRHRLFRSWSRFYLEIPKSNPKLTSNPEFMTLISELLASESKDDEKRIVLSVPKEDSNSEFTMFSLAECSRFEQQLIAILILSFLILECPEEFDARFARLLSTHLITLICDSDGVDVIATSLAADLLGKGIEFWKNHTSDIGRLLQSLVRLSGGKDDSGTQILTSAVQRALATTAQASPKIFVATIGNEALRPNISPEERASSILKLGSVIKQFPESQLVVLPRIVETLTKCLDPAEPGIRKALIRPCTSALHALTKSYPMVSFHQQSQLFAVGTDKSQKSLIIIYDLRTATKWRILEGHFGDITAIAFCEDGSMLASYSGDENPPSVRIWRAGGQGLLSGLLGLQGKCLRTFHLRQLDASEISKARMLKNTSLVWTSANSVRLTREDRSQSDFTT